MTVRHRELMMTGTPAASPSQNDLSDFVFEMSQMQQVSHSFFCLQWHCHVEASCRQKPCVAFVSF